ncbi:hypothetical protein M8J76_014937 [Diaphorina citri]|nr:hypothetical protein M8J76_014937 [Diaphorina citri]
MLCVKIGLQVVGNTVVQNDIHCVEHVWNICHPFLLSCFQYKDSKMDTIVMMILFNIYKSLPSIAQNSLVRNVILEQTAVGNEFAIYFLEELVYSNNSVQFALLFECSSRDDQLYLMEYIKSNMKPGIDVTYFMQMFNKHAFNILSDHSDVNDVQATVLCLELLAELSASSDYQKVMQDDVTFVSNIYEFLKGMHLVGKQDSRHRFAPDQNLTNLFNSTQHDVVYGVKATCVKLVANLCWSHVINQNLARTSECFPVLLDD